MSVGHQSTNESGNGGTYDGKLTYLQVQPGFRCENREAPVAVLRRNAEGQWNLVRNTPEKCGDQESVVSTPESFNKTSIVTLENAEFFFDNNVPENSKTLENYIEEIQVNTSINSNSEDIQIGDGVCRDKEGLCSLRAAIQEANSEKSKARIILLPEGVFQLNSVIALQSESFLGIFGQGPRKTIIKVSGDQGSIVTPFNYTSMTSLQNLSFQGGRSTVTYGASVLSVLGSVQLKNVLVTNNFSSPAGNPTIRAGVNARDLFISDTVISQNETSGIEIFGPESVTIKNSDISQNKGFGVDVTNGSWRIQILSSRIVENVVGVKFRKCYLGCRISDSVIAYNQSHGLRLESSYQLAEDTIVERSTIAFNAQVSGANIQLACPLAEPRNLQLIETLVARGPSSRPNCEIAAHNTNFSIVNTNSQVDDNSCPGNIQVIPPVDPLVLGPL